MFPLSGNDPVPKSFLPSSSVLIFLWISKYYLALFLQVWDRVRVTDRHCRKMQRKKILAQNKKHHLVKTSGGKKKIHKKQYRSINSSALNTCQTITLIPYFTFRCFSLSEPDLISCVINRYKVAGHCLHSLPVGTEEVTKSGSLLPLGKDSLLSKIGDQRCGRKCYLYSVGYLVNVRLKWGVT